MLFLKRFEWLLKDILPNYFTCLNNLLQHSFSFSSYYGISVLNPVEKTNRPIILAWTTFFSQNLLDALLLAKWGNGMSIVPFNQSECPYECVYSTDRQRDLSHASIVIFSPRDLNEKDVPPRNPDQLNVFLLNESPFHSDPNYKRLPPDFFNISMTYRKDSDIFMPYDSFEEIVPGTTPPNEIWQKDEVLKKLKNKTKLAVQFVSNCKTPSHREDYIEKLKKYIKISEYGKCNNHFCKEKNCFEQIIDDHLFYLAFENSLCKHYVTEKFWNVKRLTVPVVLSKKPLIGLDFPNNSYIAADDFKGPKELADHLLYLQKNFDQYLKYFEWTKVYKKSGAISPFCQLCQFAVEKKRKTIPNIVDWWEKTANALLRNIFC
uniref:Fucosyltransferase n=1 Tax=Ditylenchus dipsaci TaxID=166011 RepID=A0A915DQN2_9BILA